MTVPEVGVTSEPKVFIEGEGNRGSFVFTLSEPAPEGGLILNLGFFEEDGAGGDDTIELENIDSIEENALGLPSSITISEGATEAKLTLVSLGDEIPEDDESSTLFLLETPEYQVEPTASEATLIETDVPIVGLSVDAPTIDENGAGIFPEGAGNSASIVFNLSEPAPVGGLTLNIATFEQDGAAGDDTLETENIDSFSENALGLFNSVTISEGATEARLTFVSLGDDIPEGPEETTIFLIDAGGYTADPDASEATIIETDVEQPISDPLTVSLIPETLIATEGETFAWNFSLDRPAPAGGLSLFLPVTVNNDPAPGDVDYNIDGSSNISDFEFVVTDDVSVGFNITIAEGATEATLVSEAVVDDITEIDEIFTTVIADGADYRANPAQNQVTTTLIDAPIDSPAAFGYTVSDDTGEAYRINLETGETEALGNIPFGEEDDLEGLATIDNEVFAVSEANFGDGTLWSGIDSPPGTLIGNTGDREGTDAGAAYNPLDGLIYNIQSNIPGDDLGGGENDTVASWLYSIDPETAETNLISTSTGIFADGLAINSEGEAYASDFRETDSLYRVNLDDGSLELIGSLGLGDVTADSGLGFAPDGTLYALTENSNLYTLDSQTGAATLINSLTLDGTFLDDIDLGGLEGFTIAEEAFI